MYRVYRNMWESFQQRGHIDSEEGSYKHADIHPLPAADYSNIKMAITCKQSQIGHVFVWTVFVVSASAVHS